MSTIDTVTMILRHMIPNCNFTRENPTHIQDIANELADAGLLMPDLPAPMQRGEAERTGATSGSRWYGYEDDSSDDGSGMYSPHRYIDSYLGEVWVEGDVLLSPEDARAYALALLAAAQWAEEKSEQ